MSRKNYIKSGFSCAFFVKNKLPVDYEVINGVRIANLLFGFL